MKALDDLVLFCKILHDRKHVNKDLKGPQPDSRIIKSLPSGTDRI